MTGVYFVVEDWTIDVSRKISSWIISQLCYYGIEWHNN
jgi:hypothetical protein